MGGRVSCLTLLLLLGGLGGYLTVSGGLAETLAPLCEPLYVEPVLVLPGDVNLTAMLDLHEGDGCSKPSTRGLQQQAAIAWAVSKANFLNLIPGVTIGLEVYDTCSDANRANAATMSVVGQLECHTRYQLGVMLSESAAYFWAPLLKVLEIRVPGLHEMRSTPRTGASLATAAADLLHALNRSEAAVLASNGALLRAFSDASARREVCLTWEGLLSHNSGSPLERDSAGGTGVFLAPWTAIEAAVLGDSRLNNTDLNWLLAPMDVHWESLNAGSSSSLREGWIVAAETEVASSALREALGGEEALLAAHSWAGQLVPGALLHEVGTALQARLAHLRKALDTDCADDDTSNDMPTICPQLRPLEQHEEAAESDVAEFELEVPAEAWLVHSGLQVQFGQVYEGRLEPLGVTGGLGGVQLSENASFTPMLPCDACVCRNLVKRASVWLLMSWQHLIWVATLTSFAGVGMVCAIAVAIFISVRICKGDVLEGNPVFSYVLLLSVVAAYLAVLPWCVSGPRLVCTLRELGAGMGHALLLASMLARTLMVATTDDQGFMSHVSGFLQLVLWFFIITVQVGMSAELWIIRSPGLLSLPAPGDPIYGTGKPGLTCPSDDIPFYMMLGYNTLLLVMLLFLTPFVVRSKRNYREGLCFCVAGVMYAISWFLWLSVYLLAPDWRSPAVAGGLVSAASIVLITVFIPRTYLMVSSVARSRFASALPCTAPGLLASSNVLDVNYRSNQALYDSVNTMGPCGGSTRILHEPHLTPRGSPRVTPRGSPRGSIRCSPALRTGMANPNYYSEHPHHQQLAPPRHRGGFGGSRTPSPENTYERYDSPPSPQKVTRF